MSADAGKTTPAAPGATAEAVAAALHRAAASFEDFNGASAFDSSMAKLEDEIAGIFRAHAALIPV